VTRPSVGMHRQGYDLQLTQYDNRGWRATFYVTGMEHSPTSATGTGWERTPWHATQRAAWDDAREEPTRDHRRRMTYKRHVIISASWKLTTG
jgi:hypothetical protein